MRIKPKTCYVTCDFTHSTITIHYSDNYALPGCDIPIDISHMTVAQKANTTWKIAFAIKKTDIDDVHVCFVAKKIDTKFHYQRAIRNTLNSTLKLDNRYYCLQDSKLNQHTANDQFSMEYVIIENISEFEIRTDDSTMSIASIIDKSLHSSEYKSHFHCHIYSSDNRVYDLHVSIPVNAICEAYATITRYDCDPDHSDDDECLNGYTTYKRMDLLITAFQIFLKEIDKDQRDEWFCTDSYNNTNYIIPCIELFRKIGDLLRERYEFESGQKLEIDTYEDIIDPIYKLYVHDDDNFDNNEDDEDEGFEDINE